MTNKLGFPCVRKHGRRLASLRQCVRLRFTFSCVFLKGLKLAFLALCSARLIIHDLEKKKREKKGLRTAI